MAPVDRLATGNGSTKRRSLRLKMKRENEEKVNDLPLGYLQVLPSHIMATVFDYLPVQDIGVFSLASKQTRYLVEDYLKCYSTKRRLQLYTLHLDLVPTDKINDLMLHFHHFGVLMKRVTCLYQTKQRLQIVIDEVFSMLNCNHYRHAECLSEECPCLPFFGRFLHAMTMGWDYNEMILVIKKLQEASCILGSMRLIFNSYVGAIPHIEIRIRHFYRSVILTEHHNSYDLAFCLSNILGDKSILQKTHLLLVLYGPCKKRGLIYTELCEVVPMLNPTDMQARFSKLAGAISLLHLHSLMDRDTIFAILRCIKGLPQDWLALNYANLLIFLDEKLLVSFLGSHVQDGWYSGVATWIALMAMITNKCVRDMNWIVDVLLAVFKTMRTSNDRYLLMRCIQDAFHAEIAEFHDNSAFELDHEINFNLMLSASAQFNKCFLKKHFYQGLFK